MHNMHKKHKKHSTNNNDKSNKTANREDPRSAIFGVSEVQSQGLPRPVLEVLTGRELEILVERIIESGALGRSQTYLKLLRFFVDAALAGRVPRELDIAIGALGRDESFDVSSDSAVRVAVHQLRKKLASYYAEFEPDSALRLILPKGRHSLCVLEVESALASVPAESPIAVPPAGFIKNPFSVVSASYVPAILLLVLIALSANLVLFSRFINGADTLASTPANHPLWASVLADDKPLLIVMGDYYIFGELNTNGNVARMVREFSVNSRSDLEEFRFGDIAHAEKFVDLDLSYMPEGSAFALARVAPLLAQSGKSINVTMMSDLSSADIRANHIIYIGYISALDRLASMAFAGSGLAVGRSFDELIDLDNLTYFTSDAGLPEEGQQFRDYGFLSSFTASRDTQVILVAGMRDAGLMHTAQALTDIDSLDELLLALGNGTNEALGNVEALYEVYGIDRMNFEAKLVYSKLLESGNFWGFVDGRTSN